MDFHLHIRIDFEHTLFHNFCFIFTNRLSCCDDLTIQIRQFPSSMIAFHWRYSGVSSHSSALSI